MDYRRGALALPCMALLCLLAYWPSVRFPLISDDYIQIHLGRIYGPADQWSALAQDALYRCRATSILVTHWTELWLGIGTLPLNASSLLVHFFNTVLVLLAGSWRRIGWRVSVPAACFFAVSERSQEAVVWYAALPELLIFFFVLGGLLCWVRWLEEKGWWWYGAAFVCYLLALLSKESAVMFGPMAAGIAWLEGRSVRKTIPFFLLAVIYYVAAHAARDQHLHFNDGTFSQTAPFLLTSLRSAGRLLWFWGLAAVGVILYFRRRPALGWIGGAAGWIFLALLPYSFLTYQSAVPSRHTYLASAGLAFLVGRAFVEWGNQNTHPRYRLALVAVLCLGWQVGYLWLYKYPQYIDRAQPTETLIQAVRDHNGPVRLTCFQYTEEVAQRALEIGTGGAAWLLTTTEESAGAELAVDSCGERRN